MFAAVSQSFICAHQLIFGLFGLVVFVSTSFLQIRVFFRRKTELGALLILFFERFYSTKANDFIQYTKPKPVDTEKERELDKLTNLLVSFLFNPKQLYRNAVGLQSFRVSLCRFDALRQCRCRPMPTATAANAKSRSCMPTTAARQWIKFSTSTAFRATSAVSHQYVIEFCQTKARQWPIHPSKSYTQAKLCVVVHSTASTAKRCAKTTISIRWKSVHSVANRLQTG